jgi:protein-S-isoprenylcysteine O-methyltransferase Ste14
MTAADPQAAPGANTGAAVRFPLPPVLFAVPLALALAADRWVLRLPLPVAGRRGPRAIGAAIAVGGVLFSLSGMLTVLRHGTTVVPHHAVARLVTTGPFRLTRNPMYTGHLIVFLGATGPAQTGSARPIGRPCGSARPPTFPRWSPLAPVRGTAAVSDRGLASGRCRSAPLCTGGPLGRPPVASSAMSPHPETEINNGGEDHHGER